MPLSLLYSDCLTLLVLVPAGPVCPGKEAFKQVLLLFCFMTEQMSFAV